VVVRYEGVCSIPQASSTHEDIPNLATGCTGKVVLDLEGIVVVPLRELRRVLEHAAVDHSCLLSRIG
jgi:hypothetical protein